MFVTQTPFGQDFANIMSTFGTHNASTSNATRGGDLYIRYGDGTLRNLTDELGYGNTAGQEITVRDPSPHWGGGKALFSMAIGGTVKDDYTPVYFQIYEIVGIPQGEPATIRKIAQPADYNNITPVYLSTGRILFTSDRPRNGDRRLYPQLDEYETADTVSGIYVINPDGSGLEMFDHAPSGDFTPFLDSFGRIVWTRWDHLQRDQQADADVNDLIAGRAPTYEANTYASEDSDTPLALAPGDEIFPEQRTVYGGNTPDPIWDFLRPTEEVHSFNFFFPWMMTQNGEGLEIVNHLGRHEMAGYIAPSRTYLEYAGVESPMDLFMQICEDPTNPGHYYGIRCPEFGTRSAGQIVRLNAPPTRNADDIAPEYITHPETAGYDEAGAPRDPDHVGMFRDPVVLSDGTLWASHSQTNLADRETVENPPYPSVAPYVLSSRYDFAIKKLVSSANGYRIPGERLVPGGIIASISYFDNNYYRPVVYNGPMWELQAIEVYPHSAPPAPEEPLPAIEQNVLEEELGGTVGVAALKTYLRENGLALIISRDVTVRNDKQQDFNLKVAWSDHQTAAPTSTPKKIAYMQFFEGKQVRGFRWDGRRVLARAMDSAENPRDVDAPESAVRLGDDGSMAAFVPAARALSWQSTETDGTPVVRERYWLTFKAGEVRVCANCHGLNRNDVFNNPGPTNEPEALRTLVRWWLEQQP